MLHLHLNVSAILVMLPNVLARLVFQTSLRYILSTAIVTDNNFDLLYIKAIMLSLISTLTTVLVASHENHPLKTIVSREVILV